MGTIKSLDFGSDPQPLFDKIDTFVLLFNEDLLTPFYTDRSVFQEMISMDSLIVQILSQAQRLTGTDKASLFIVDTKTKQLYSRSSRNLVFT